MLHRLLPLTIVVISLCACTATIYDRSGSASSITLDATAYEAAKGQKAVVLMAINWGRRWNCGGFENAELRMLAFDHLPPQSVKPDAPADLVIEGPPRLTTKPEFTNYAFLLEPGEYALSAFSVKLAQSMTDIKYWGANRGHLIQDGTPAAGSFTLAAGEIVYIGNFWLDCTDPRNPWRFYTDKNGWPAHLSEYKQKYPFLDTQSVVYRLFATQALGMPYELE